MRRGCDPPGQKARSRLPALVAGWMHGDYSHPDRTLCNSSGSVG